MNRSLSARPAAERRSARGRSMFLDSFLGLRVAVLMKRRRIPNRFVTGRQIGRFDKMLPRFVDLAQRVERQPVIIMGLSGLRRRRDRLRKELLGLIELPSLIGLRSLFGQGDGLCRVPPVERQWNERPGL